MIFLCGITSEYSLKKVIAEVEKLGVPMVVFHQRNFLQMQVQFQIQQGSITGRIHLAGKEYALEGFTGIFTRLMDFSLLPEIENEPLHSPKRQYCRALSDTLVRWFDIAPIRVLNRRSEIGANYSKPYQAQQIQEAGFKVPDSLITNDPDLVRDFLRAHKQIIYKSISSIRSIVKKVDEKDLDRLHSIRWCPTQFQKFIEGTNVRVHTVGDKVFPAEIISSTVDYRYAHLEGNQEQIRAIELSDEWSEKCVKLSRAFGLEFAGIDLKVTPDNEVYCFEVNPGPAYSYYEHYTGQPIAKEVARYLAGIN